MTVIKLIPVQSKMSVQMVSIVVVISVLSNVQMVSLQKRLKRQNVFKKVQWSWNKDLGTCVTCKDITGIEDKRVQVTCKLNASKFYREPPVSPGYYCPMKSDNTAIKKSLASHYNQFSSYFFRKTASLQPYLSSWNKLQWQRRKNWNQTYL